METQVVKKRKKTLFSFYKPQEEASTSKESSPPSGDNSNHNQEGSSSSQNVEINVGAFEVDPGLRTPISQYPANEKDDVRRRYIGVGPQRPNHAVFPATKMGDQSRRFQRSWYKRYSWLEYSTVKDAAFCFQCYLFENDSGCYHSFTVNGFKNWKKVGSRESCAFFKHVGGPTSPHNNAMKSYYALKDPTRHIDKVMNAHSSEEVQTNRLRLQISIEGIRYLSSQGCASRGHDESSTSNNRGNLIEFIKVCGKINPEIAKIVLEKAPGNAKYIAPCIQKDILYILANRVRIKIREEIGDAKFCILVDEAKDISGKEQMAIVLRFVDSGGFIRERFFEIVHVVDTSAVTLKREISRVLAQYNLPICDLRGQGYDGASNMSGQWNGLQALFLRDSPYAYHVHCFAHRLQLALVGAAEQEMSIWLFFSELNKIVNLIGGSSKRLTQLHSAQVVEIEREIASGERATCTGANQVGSLQRAGKTRWSSHFDSICSLIDEYSAVIEVLKIMRDDRSSSSSNSTRGEALGHLKEMVSYDFVFNLYFMHKVMGVTDMLSRALQTKSLDILNAMDHVTTSKALFQKLRGDDAYDSLILLVESACEKHGIEIPDMEGFYKSGRGRQHPITFEHHYHFDVFHATIDFQVAELNRRFSDEAVELLKLSSNLDPKENFKSFNIDRIYTLAEKFYPGDFSGPDLHRLRCQLDCFEVDVIGHEKFQNISTISELCQQLKETNKAQDYDLIDKLIRLVLTLPVSTATPERAFSAMKHVKSARRNKMEEEYLSNSMVLFIERDLAKDIDSDTVIDEFYRMSDRRLPLQ